VGVLARQSPAARPAASLALDLFAGASAEVSAELADGMADLVPPGQLRDLDLAERVEAELEIFGFDVSQHVLAFYADLLSELAVVRSADLDTKRNGEMILVAGAKVATQTPAVRSGQRIIFASLDDEMGLVDLAFFESVQDRCAARLFGSWLLLARGKVRRAGAGPMAVTVNATECWDLPALEEIRLAEGMDAVRAAMAAGDVGPGTRLNVPLAPQADSDANAGTDQAASPRDGAPGDDAAGDDAAGDLGEQDADEQDAGTRPIVFGNGFILSPYAETGAPGGSLKNPPRRLWHTSPGSTQTPN
jgi:error-prone DNA polymerase